MELSAFSDLQNSKELGIVGVFWDIENMSPPSVIPASQTCTRIVEFVSKFGIVHSINAYGDIQRFRKEIRTEIQHSGINFYDVPSGKKNAADTAILVDMLLFAVDHRPPATIVLISGDGDFSNALSRLRQRGYNVFLNLIVVTILGHVCTNVFEWSDVVKMQEVLQNSTTKQKEDVSVNENYRFLIDFLLNQDYFKASLSDVVKELADFKVKGFNSIGDFLRAAQEDGIVTIYELNDGEVYKVLKCDSNVVSKVRLRSNHIKASFISLADLMMVLKALKKDLFFPLEGFIKSRLAKLYGVKRISPIEWDKLVELAQRAGFLITKHGSEVIVYPPSGTYESVDTREFNKDIIDEAVFEELKYYIVQLDGTNENQKIVKTLGTSFSGKVPFAEYVQQNGPPSCRALPLALKICSMLVGAQEEGLVSFHKKKLFIGKPPDETSPSATPKEGSGKF